MKPKRYTEEQSISILKAREAGAAVLDLSRRHGVAENMSIPEQKRSIRRRNSPPGIVRLTGSDL